MAVEYRVTVNGIEVDAVYSEHAVNGIFMPLLRKLEELRKEQGRRILVMLAAPPGAGKSTLVSFLSSLAGGKVRGIGMDGFHRRQEYLQSHWVQKDGQRIPMVEIKGAPVTFDLEKLAESIRRVRDGGACGWPVYDRMLHNPVEDAVTVDSGIVILEGNYLLLDEDGWRDLRQYADYTVSVSADEGMLRERLIERRMKTGVDREAAVRFVDFSDMLNVRLCLGKTMPADLRLMLDESGEYRRIKD